MCRLFFQGLYIIIDLEWFFIQITVFYGSVVDILIILIDVWGFQILLFVVGGFLIHSCDLRHRLIFFSFLFWCVSEV